MLDTKYLKDKFNVFLDNFIDSLPNIILSIIIFAIFYIIAEYYKSTIINPKTELKNFIKQKTGQEFNFEYELKTQQEMGEINNNLDNNLIYYQLNWVIYYSIIIFGLIISLVNLGFNVATIITLLGSIGLALGLALQETLKNMISGIYISINKLFKLGDIISLNPFGNSVGKIGKVIDFNLYYTVIIDKNKQISIIPNALIQNNILTNVTESASYYV